MSKIAVVYWSGTGNTESMANKVADGAKAAGAEVSIFTAAQFDAGKVAGYDAIAFGCPAMGSEQLEEDEFEPMFNGCKEALRGKRIALTAGETVSGCAPGRPQPRALARTWPVRASFVPTLRTLRPRQTARLWARPWLEQYYRVKARPPVSRPEGGF